MLRSFLAMARIRVLTTLVLSLCCLPIDADDWFTQWLARSDDARAAQPHWMTPLVTVTPRLEQEFRQDFVIQQPMAASQVMVLGNGKGPANQEESFKGGEIRQSTKTGYASKKRAWHGMAKPWCGNCVIAVGYCTAALLRRRSPRHRAASDISGKERSAVQSVP